MKNIFNKIESFLKDKIKIEPGNERAKATTDDIEKLNSIIQMVCKAKWEASYDGWVPADVLVINRSTHEAFHYETQPYDKNEEKQENFEEKMRIATRMSEQLLRN